MTPERWQHIERLYHAALEHAADERAAYLAEACAEDEALRREVEVLLAANAQASGFLTRPAIGVEARDLVAEKPTAPLDSPVGQQLNHYKILSRIGAGGMGEVYLARDTRLERRVALKLLPAQFTEDAERLQRFVREAKAASALNHPNIITIYEIGEVVTATGKTHFIATEFIEGETLRRRGAGEGVTLREALEIAIQIAAALDAAHKAGIVHRDIKPENLMLRPDGLVKVLDFGLAKLTAQTSGGNEVDTDAQTLPEGMKTQPGMILGTLRYMSPEQARGRALDARTDLFSLGVVLYELLTGRPLFDGETSADVIAAIIHKEPAPLADYVPEATPELERIVRRALAKDSRERYQDARDLQIDLQTLKQESELSARLQRSGQKTQARQKSLASGKLVSQASSQLTVPRFTLKQLLLAVPVVALSLSGLWWVANRRGNRVEAPPPELLKPVEVVNWQSSSAETYSIGAFSPDGKWVAFSSTQGGSKNIWIKQAASGDAEPSTKDEYANENPIWSPDGNEIAFFSLRGNQPGIWRKSTFGGTPTLLTALPSGGQSMLRYWSKKSGTIYYELNKNLFALDVNSKQSKKITDFATAKVNVNDNSLSISPDEQRIAYITPDENRRSSVWVAPLSGRAPKQIANHSGVARNTVWHPDGKRIFYSAQVEGTYQIFVADVDGRTPAQITFGDKDSYVLDVSADGTKVLYGSSKEELDIWGVDVAKAKEFAVATDISAELWPDVSPDNQMITYQAVRNLSQGNKIFVSSILTKALGADAQSSIIVKESFLPKWSPDGKRIAFLQVTNDAYNLWTINTISGEEKQLTIDGLSPMQYSVLPYNQAQVSFFSWSPDSQYLVYPAGTGGQRNLWMVSADDSKKAQITTFNDPNLVIYSPLWSTDGKRIAWSSRPNKSSADGKLTYSVWITDVGTKTSKTVFQADSTLRLLGWSPTEQELILALVKAQARPGLPTELGLVRVSIQTGKQQMVASLSSTYLLNIYLSADRRMIAFTSRQEGKDNIWAIPTSGGQAKELTANPDPRLYFSSLAWSPDGRAIYFGKQSRHSQLSMITNFK
jgi:serine/threonine protein kinase